MSRLILFVLLAGFYLLPVTPALSAVSNTIPLDSWVYPALEKLEGLGLVDSAMKGARPYSRLETVRQIREARTKMDASPVPAVATELLDRLALFLDDELQAGAGAGSYLKPLREVRVAAG